MFLNIVKIIAVLMALFLILLGCYLVAQYFGLISKLWNWWSDFKCYFTNTLMNVESASPGLLLIAIVLIILGLICLRLGLSIQRK